MEKPVAWSSAGRRTGVEVELSFRIADNVPLEWPTKECLPEPLGTRLSLAFARAYRTSQITLHMTVTIAAMLALAGSAPGAAQGFVYNQPHPHTKPAPAPHDGQMLVQAVEVDYDYNNSRVSAVGNVQMFYNGTSIQADRVIYDQKTKRLRAEGNIRMIDADGKITYADILDLSDDYRDGFVDSLRVDTADATRMAARRADRSNGNYTVFENGVYTACAPCRDDPKKPPLWQVKGARIIHDQQEKMLYFEDAKLEFLGIPMAYLPYFSTPDPTVKRKTGFLTPQFTTATGYGYGIGAPFYWAIAGDYDATITPTYTSKQGLLTQVEFRQRLIDGAYQIRAYGIDQQNPAAFAGQPGERRLRGGIETRGQFALNDKWVWGWDGVLLSDRQFFADYKLSQYTDLYGAFLNVPTEAVSQLYLTGVGSRSFFDARTVYDLSYSGNQSQVPVVHPVIDYSTVIGQPVMGGEFSMKSNFTSLSRDAAAFDPVNTKTGADGLGLCTAISADPQARLPSNCLLRGIPGTYTRMTVEAEWRRSFTDTYGQVWTPFAILRADAIDASISNQPGVSNFLPAGDTQAARVMPTLGLEYRYPFIDVQPWGATTVEPVAQLIVRPNETYAGKLPNEDAQSMIFDASNLFDVDKFSGYDRVEGGGRANVGVETTTQFDRGGSIKVLAGQSYQLFGQNSFAVGGITSAGLATPSSDYVARVSYSPNRTYTLSTRARFDEAALNVQRFETEAKASFDRWSISVTYGNYAAQPELGYPTRRDGVLASGSVKIVSNWVVTGAARWDLQANNVNQYVVGAGYVDDCIILGVNYVSSYAYSAANTSPTLSQALMLQFGMRTIGSYSVPLPSKW